MSDKYDYGPWIGWNGGECPVEPHEIVQPCLRCFGKSEIGNASGWRWNHSETGRRADIIAYRIATPKPKRELVVGAIYEGGDGKRWRILSFDGERYAAEEVHIRHFLPNGRIEGSGHGINMAIAPRTEEDD